MVYNLNMLENRPKHLFLKAGIPNEKIKAIAEDRGSVTETSRKFGITTQMVHFYRGYWNRHFAGVDNA